VDDAVLQRQTWARCKAVLRGKAHGAWVLHDITRELPLDFFVLYSAAGVLLGAAGQGAYPAANAELDALAQARRRCGLPALSVAWGSWADVGMAARLAKSGHDVWAERGLAKITPATGFAALARLMQDGSTYAAVLSIDWSRFLAHLPWLRPRCRARSRQRRDRPSWNACAPCPAGNAAKPSSLTWVIGRCKSWGSMPARR
jgi:hypothetical protein